MPKACNFIKKETLAQVFSCEFCEIFKNTFFVEHVWWLLLDILEKACYLPTTMKMFIFGKVAGPGLSPVASFATKITFFTETFTKIVPHAELNSLNSLKIYLHYILKNCHHLHYSLQALSNKNY